MQLQTDGVVRVLGLSLRLALSISLVLAGWVVYHRYQGQKVFRSGQGLAVVQAANQWDPSDSDFYFNMGLLYRDQIEYWDMDAARTNFEASTRLNPYNWRYWLELGRTYEILGDIDSAEKAYVKTVELNPKSAVYRWRLANFYLRSGDLEQTIPLLRSALQLDGSYLESVFSLLMKLGVETEVIDSFWPEDKGTQLRALRFLASRNELSESLTTYLSEHWKALTSRYRLSIGEGDFYLRHLLDKGRFIEARSEWIRLVEGIQDPDQAIVFGENAIWNGDFEKPLAGGTFGWHFPYSHVLTFRRVLEGSHSSYALRLDFSARSNPDFKAAFQRVVLEPGKQYELSMLTRSLNLTTEQGVFAEVTTPAGDLLVRTPQVRGSSPWEVQKGTFAVPDDVSLVFLHLRRLPSRRIDGSFQGSFWLDAIELTRTGGDS